MNVVGAAKVEVCCHAEKKTLYLIRHGIAVHNVAQHENKNFDPASELYTDAPLISRCESQSMITGKKLRDILNARTGDSTSIELIVVSPLTRCIQTAAIAFPGCFDAVPVVCHEDVREAHGVNTADRRRRRTDIEVGLPLVITKLTAECQAS